MNKMNEKDKFLVFDGNERSQKVLFFDRHL
jgi:hypothetical protein